MNVRQFSQAAAYGVDDIPGFRYGGGNLAKQRQEGMIVVAIDMTTRSTSRRLTAG